MVQQHICHEGKTYVLYINVKEYRRDNPEKLATLGTQDEEKQSKNTAQQTQKT